MTDAKASWIQRRRAIPNSTVLFAFSDNHVLVARPFDELMCRSVLEVLYLADSGFSAIAGARLVWLSFTEVRFLVKSLYAWRVAQAHELVAKFKFRLCRFLDVRLEKGYSWKRRDATNSDKIHKIEKKIIINNGTSACPESLMCSWAAIIKRKPIAEENNSRFAVDFELDWHENKTIPINAAPAPIVFRNATPTIIASWFSAMFGNIDKVKNSGNTQNDPPRIIIKAPLSANMARELCNIGNLQSATITYQLLSPLVWSDSVLMELFKYTPNVFTSSAQIRGLMIVWSALGVYIGAAFCTLFWSAELMLAVTSTILVLQEVWSGLRVRFSSPAFHCTTVIKTLQRRLF